MGRQPTSWSYYSTLVLILQVGGGIGFPRDGWQGLGMGGLVAARALLQRGDWLGLAPLSRPLHRRRGCAHMTARRKGQGTFERLRSSYS